MIAIGPDDPAHVSSGQRLLDARMLPKICRYVERCRKAVTADFLAGRAIASGVVPRQALWSVSI